MRLRRLLRAVSWKYALGEIAIVTVGVLLALALNNWNESRLERQREIASLRELESALRSDLQDIRFNAAFHRQGQVSTEIIRHHMRQDLPYADSLDSHFARVLNATFLVESRTAYETLKARGLELISNDSLRAAIASLYDVDYQAIQHLEDIDERLMDRSFYPFYLQHFDDAVLFQTATPVDYAALQRNHVFEQMLSWRADVRDKTVPMYDHLETAVEGLIAATEQEISRRQ